jgi:hypothetical protein
LEFIAVRRPLRFTLIPLSSVGTNPLADNRLKYTCPPRDSRP